MLRVRCLEICDSAMLLREVTSNQRHKMHRATPTICLERLGLQVLGIPANRYVPHCNVDQSQRLLKRRAIMEQPSSTLALHGWLQTIDGSAEFCAIESVMWDGGSIHSLLIGWTGQMLRRNRCRTNSVLVQS